MWPSWNLNICRETSFGCGQVDHLGNWKGAEPQKEKLTNDGRRRYEEMIERQRRKGTNQDEGKKEEEEEEEDAVRKVRRCSSDTQGPLISGSACLGSQLSHSSLDECYSVFSSKFHGERLIQYNRVHFVLICMYRWLILRNWICRRLSCGTCFPFAGRSISNLTRICPWIYD